MTIDAPALMLPAELRLAAPPARPAPAAVAPAGTAPGERAPSLNGASSFEQAMAAYQREQMAAPQWKPKKRGVARRAVGWLVTLAVLGGLGFGGWYVYMNYIRSPELPTFDSAPPPYGSATYRIIGDGMEVEVVIDPTRTTSLTTVHSGAEVLGAEELIMTDVFTFVRSGGVWYRAPLTPDAVRFRQMAAKVTWDDWLPPAARPFVSVQSVDDGQIDGHEVQTYDLAVDLDAFGRDDPAGFADFQAKAVDGSAGRVRLVLSVDSDGVVWRGQAWPDEDPAGGPTTVALVSLDSGLPQITLPTEFISRTGP